MRSGGVFYSERFRKANGSNTFRFIKDMFQTELNRVKNTCLIEKTKRLYEYHLSKQLCLKTQTLTTT